MMSEGRFLLSLMVGKVRFPHAEEGGEKKVGTPQFPPFSRSRVNESRLKLFM